MIIRNETVLDIEAISEVTRAAVKPDRSAFKECYVDLNSPSKKIENLVDLDKSR